MLKRFLITLAVVSFFLPVVALADQITILQFNENGDNASFNLTDNGSSEEFTVSNTVQVTLGAVYGGTLGGTTVNATIVIDAISLDEATNPSGAVSETGFGSVADFTISNLADGLLLGGSFNGALLSGLSGDTTVTLQDSWPPSSKVTYTSDYDIFSPGPGQILTNQGFALSVSGLSPALGIAGAGSTGFITSTNGSGTGTFSESFSDQETPEPVTFLLAGGALLGLGLLRKRKSHPVL
jgi:hypothetical protein